MRPASGAELKTAGRVSHLVRLWVGSLCSMPLRGKTLFSTGPSPYLPKPGCKTTGASLHIIVDKQDPVFGAVRVPSLRARLTSVRDSAGPSAILHHQAAVAKSPFARLKQHFPSYSDGGDRPDEVRTPIVRQKSVSMDTGRCRARCHSDTRDSIPPPCGSRLSGWLGPNSLRHGCEGHPRG